MDNVTFEGLVNAIEVEDGGKALIFEVPPVSECSMFVRLHSWNDNGEHPEMEALKGKTIRVTIEVKEG